MSKLFKFIGSAIVFSFLVVFLLPSSCSAEVAGVQISPLFYDYNIDLGQSQSGNLNIKSLVNSSLDYVLETENFKEVSEQGAPIFEGADKPDGISTLADWITFTEPKTGSIVANGQADIHFSITVPIGAEAGGHYAAIFARQVNTTSAQLGVASRVGLLILVTVPGKVSKTAEITDYTFKSFIWKGPADFSLKVKNTGTVHYDSTAEVTLSPVVGRNTVLNLGKHTILPSNTRAYSGTWQSKFPFGYYNMTVSATDGNGDKVEQTGVIWAIPVILISIIIVSIAILWLLILYIKQNFKVSKKDGNKPAGGEASGGSEPPKDDTGPSDSADNNQSDNNGPIGTI